MTLIQPRRNDYCILCSADVYWGKIDNKPACDTQGSNYELCIDYSHHQNPNYLYYRRVSTLLPRIMSSFVAYIGNNRVYFDRRSLYPCLSLSIVRLEDIVECLPPRKHEKKGKYNYNNQRGVEEYNPGRCAPCCTGAIENRMYEIVLDSRT